MYKFQALWFSFVIGKQSGMTCVAQWLDISFQQEWFHFMHDSLEHKAQFEKGHSILVFES